MPKRLTPEREQEIRARREAVETVGLAGAAGGESPNNALTYANDVQVLLTEIDRLRGATAEAHGRAQAIVVGIAEDIATSTPEQSAVDPQAWELVIASNLSEERSDAFREAREVVLDHRERAFKTEVRPIDAFDAAAAELKRLAEG